MHFINFLYGVAYVRENESRSVRPEMMPQFLKGIKPGGHFSLDYKFFFEYNTELKK